MKPGSLYGRNARLRVGTLAAAALLLVGSAGVFARETMDCIVDSGVNNVDYVLVVPGLILVGSNLGLVVHNASRLNAGEPSGLGGMGGILFGALGMVYGVLCTGYSDESVVRVTGIGCAVAGAASFYFGVRRTRASNKKHDEAEEGLTFDPVLINDGAGRLGPGVQVSWKF